MTISANTIESEKFGVDPYDPKGQARRAYEAAVEQLYEAWDDDKDMAHRIATAEIVKTEMRLWRKSRNG